MACSANPTIQRPTGTIRSRGSGVGDIPRRPFGPTPLKPPAPAPEPIPPKVEQPPPNVLSSRVTAAVSAKALPHEIVAPVSSVMLADARIFPSNAVVVPSVAEL